MTKLKDIDVKIIIGQEIKTNEFIDNKRVYKKRINFGTLPNSTSKTVAQYYKECQYKKDYLIWQYSSSGKVGDEVISFNDNTRKYESKKITKCLSHFTNEIYLIYLNNEIIRATYDHPMSTLRKDRILVKDLEVGDVLVSNKEHKEILDIKTKYETVLVYDIGVEDNNNYFIGESNILVYSEPITIKS